MLSFVFFVVFFRDSGIVTAQIYLAYCYCVMGNCWAMWDASYKQNLLDFRKRKCHSRWQKENARH